MRCAAAPDLAGWTTGADLVAPSRSAAFVARRFAQPNEEHRRTNTVTDSIVVACMGTSFELSKHIRTRTSTQLSPGCVRAICVFAPRSNVQVREVILQFLALLLHLLLQLVALRLQLLDLRLLLVQLGHQPVVVLALAVVD